jgi:hypothetical protein
MLRCHTSFLLLTAFGTEGKKEQEGLDFSRPTSAASLRMTLSEMLWANSFVRYFTVSSVVFGLWNVICIMLFRFKGIPSLIY